MLTVVRILHAQRWKDSLITTVEEWMVKGMELLEIAKINCFIKDNNLSSSVSISKPLPDFVLKVGKKMKF